MKLEDVGVVERARTDYFDVYRGIGILCMIICHVYIGFTFDKFVHAFHMPMFFFVTGYFFSIKKTSVFLKKKVRSLIVPYIFWGCFNLLVYGILNGTFYKEAFIHLIWNNTDGLMAVGAVWFLTALFWASMGYHCLQKLIKNKLFQSVIICFIFCFGVYFRKFFSFSLPWAMEQACVAIGFIHLGKCTKEREILQENIISKLLNMRWYIMAVASLIDVLLIFLNGYVNMRICEYSNIVLFALSATLSIYLLINLSKLVCQFSSSCNFLKKIKQWLASVGKNSISYLCLNQIIICSLVKLLPFFNEYLRKAVVFIMVLFIIYFFDKLISSCRMKILIGK